ncbi:hypothetical protein ACJEBK_19775 [Peribacillus frigoritolerans]|uniref:hypothetical protein n=1 Tax=Peribacillus frigoritolerans TaxID=450367 RepID=UPI0038726119
MEKYEGYDKHSTKVFCEAFNIGASSFKHKKRRQAALDKVRLSHDVIEEKIGRENFFYTKSKGGLINILNCNIGNKDMNVIETILKIILEEKIVPVQAEYARVTGKSQSTISDHINFLKKNNIILPAPTETVIVSSKETGEILSKYEKKIGDYVYYDITPNGSYVKLDEGNQVFANNMYKKLWTMEYFQIGRMQQKYSIYESDLKGFKTNVNKLVWVKMNEEFNLHNGQRKIIPNINPEVKQQLIEYFGIGACNHGKGTAC